MKNIGAILSPCMSYLWINLPIVTIHDFLSIDGITDSCRSAVSFHRFKTTVEHGTLFDLVPVVKHIAILNRTGDFFLTTRNHLAFESLNCLFQALLRIFPSPHRFKEVRNITDTMVEALPAV